MSLLSYERLCPLVFEFLRSVYWGEKCGTVARRLREKAAYLSEKWQAQLGTPMIGENHLTDAPARSSLTSD